LGFDEGGHFLRISFFFSCCGIGVAEYFQDLKKKKNNGEGEWYGGDEKERISQSINQSL
jgi:hypothetical protein